MNRIFNIAIKRRTPEGTEPVYEWQVIGLMSLASVLTDLIYGSVQQDLIENFISTPDKPKTILLSGSKENNTGLRLIITEIKSQNNENSN